VPYLTPEEIPEDDDCRPLSIPASSEWLAIVSGALTELTKTWNWQQQGAVTVEEAVARMQQMVDAYYDVPCATCELPEGGAIIRQNGLGEFEQLIDGAWQEPQGDYELPPIPARSDPTAAERKCIAAANAIEVLRLLYEDMTDSYNLDLDPAVAFTAWVGTTSTVVLVALGLLSFGLGTVLFGVWTLMYEALDFLTEDVWGEGFTEKAICALLLTAEDDAGVVTFSWRTFMDNLALGVNLFDPSIGELRLFGQIYYMLLILGSDGLNQAGATTSIADYNCDDCSAWCYHFEDGAQLNSWTSELWNGVGDTAATYSSGVWQNGQAGIGVPDNDVAYIHLRWEFSPSIVITDAAAHSPELPGGGMGIWKDGDGSIFSGTNIWTSGGGYTGGQQVVSSLDVLFWRPINDLTPFVIDWIQLSGVLEQPFGESNC